jgi:hypothetical protein
MKLPNLLILLCVLCGCATTSTLPNGCVVDAVSYKYSVLAKSKLADWGDSKILLVKYSSTATQHAYCVWKQPPYLYAYDERSGAFAVRTTFYGPLALATAIEGPGVVERAEFLP